jgi:hypothetical protein
MNNEQEWIDWHPKVGDLRPQVYRWKAPGTGRWYLGTAVGSKVTQWDVDTKQQFQIPAAAVTPSADRPPWIDPQCKFRWGDRVKHANGSVYFVIHPYDKDNQPFPVVVAKELHAAVPYSTQQDLLDNGLWETFAVDAVREEHLELCPEDLPQHFDDRLLDADGPQETKEYGSFVAILNDRFPEMWEKALRKAYGPIPRDIWVNEYPNCLGRAFTSYDTAKEEGGEGSIRIVHFREVL